MPYVLNSSEWIVGKIMGYVFFVIVQSCIFEGKDKLITPEIAESSCQELYW